MQRLSISLGSFIHQDAISASQQARSGMSIPLLGQVTSPTLQICPQNTGMLNEGVLDTISANYPSVDIRLHANVQMLPLRILMDIVNFDRTHPYWVRLRELIKHVEMKVYSAHAGLRGQYDMDFVLQQQSRLMDFLGIPVALEGHYPTRDNRYLASDWSEWAQIYQSGLPFVVDLSHAAIIAHLKRHREDGLLIDMLKDPNCLEVHISGNDGRADQHTSLHGHEWWWPLMQHIHSDAEIFYEGVFRS